MVDPKKDPDPKLIPDPKWREKVDCDPDPDPKWSEKLNLVSN